MRVVYTWLGSMAVLVACSSSSAVGPTADAGSSGGGGACPSGESQACFGAAADTCYCGSTCSADTDCTSPETCNQGRCVTLATYCAALFAENPSNPYVPCAPYQPQTGGTCRGPSIDCPAGDTCTCTAIGSPGSLLCSVTPSNVSCCPAATPFYCPGGCYATAADALAVCSQCVACAN